MRKRYLFFCQLALMSSIQANAQFSVGDDPLRITSSTPFHVMGLLLIPTSQTTMQNTSLSVLTDPIMGNPPGIGRVYQFTSPFSFAGQVSFGYDDSELNGNPEENLEVYYEVFGSGYIGTTGSNRDTDNNVIGNTVNNPLVSGFTAMNSVTLPVKLVDFSLNRENNRTVLSWQTTFERNSSYFEVQRRAKAETWEVLGRVTAMGESEAVNAYSFTDQVDRLGIQYYRLKMVDQDGTFAYSPVLSLSLSSTSLVRAYPNPVIDELNLETGEAISRLRLTDLAGRKLIDEANPNQAINLGRYPAGIYLLNVETASGQSQVIKVLKK